MDFRVELNIFRGPLDLLLYLVRKHEVEITEIPIAEITRQYLEYVELLRELDVGLAGEFLALASALLEIKSQQVLPHADAAEEADPLGQQLRTELVQRLLEYKRFRDAAAMLEERSRLWQLHYPRLADDLPAPARKLGEQPLEQVELWDLVSAFGRIMRETEAARPSSIVYDETPIHVYMARIHARLMRQGQLAFRALFEPGMHKSTLISIFLAVLELVRHQQVRVDQNELFGEIWLLPNPDCAEPPDFSQVDDYQGSPRA